MDRILGTALLVFGAAVIAIALGPDPGVTAWVAQAVLEAAFTGLSWQLAQRRDQGSGTRRFWEAAAVAGLIFTAGAVLRAAQSANHPGTVAGLSTVPTILLTVATGVLLAFLLSRPWGSGRRVRKRLWLDMSIVLISGGVAVWMVTLIGRGDAHRTGQLVWTMAGAVILLAAAVALVRVVYTRSTPVRLLVGVTLTLAIAVFGVGHVLNPQLQTAPDLRAVLVVRMVPALLLVAAARFEQLRNPAPPARDRRAAAGLPFVAVAATQILLIVELATGGLTDRAWGALAGTVIVTGLVMIRQHLVFVENARLVRGLDETVAALGRQEDRLRYAARHDHLTGLPNRAALDERAKLLSSTEGQGRAVLLLDLNEFKAVNDTLGHHAGDRLLKVIANRLRRSVRPTDLVARLGGDEFSVLLADASASDAVEAAHRIMGDLARRARIAGRTLRPSASIGIAASHHEPFETLLRNADEAMYEAKRRNSGFHLHAEGDS
ncbi:GGDEF domain-containing protein [Asanoa sp. NPDC049573]|uniref:GGDEF domain-containing protein n=1 Tax=Asanoa sp. NPDC049573 TaxID=3155396 RepID=UPI0034186616